MGNKETHKEAAERLSELQEATYTIQHKTTYTHGFVDGAKWQQNNSYSEEEVLDILKTFLYNSQMGKDVEDVELWFEQFKNK